VTRRHSESSASALGRERGSAVPLVLENDCTPRDDDPRWAAYWDQFRRGDLPSEPRSARSFLKRETSDVTSLVSRRITQHSPQESAWHRSVGSVRAVQVFKRDVKVRRAYNDLPMVGGGTRGKVDAFSKASRRRLKFVAANSSEELVSQFCLTWHEQLVDGATAKKMLNAWLTAMRRTFPGFRYLWVLEFQTRGFPHFHVFTNQPVARDTGAYMAIVWNRITKETVEHLEFHGHERNFIAWDMGSAAYLTKYLDKEAQKCVPAAFGWSGRFWGATRGLVGRPTEVTPDDLRTLYADDGKDPLVIALRALDRYQQAQWRRTRYRGRRLLSRSFSCSVSAGAAVFWRVLDSLLTEEERTSRLHGVLPWSDVRSDEASPMRA